MRIKFINFKSITKLKCLKCGDINLISPKNDISPSSNLTIKVYRCRCGWKHLICSNCNNYTSECICKMENEDENLF